MMNNKPKPPSKNTPAAAEPELEVHGLRELGALSVRGYSLQLREKGGFIGDQASQTAFRKLLDRWRKRGTKKGRRGRNQGDALGGVPSADLSKRTIDRTLSKDRPGEVGDLVHGAIDEFAHELAYVVQRFVRQPSWKGVQRVVIGGGFPESDVGERAVLQAAAVLHEIGLPVQLGRLSHETDDGGLIGWVHLVPSEMLERHDAILAVDIGGTNVRCGIVRTRRRKAPDLSKAKVIKREKWRHADDDPSRTELIEQTARMLQDMIRYCDRKRIRLAPFIGIACPGLIRKDGSIARGAQNLPGDWESPHFHLPSELSKQIPMIGKQATLVQMHNDAVVQGLSELPFMRDVKRWAVMTIGTGLGNASFVNRKSS
jgi:hypothetical protein